MLACIPGTCVLFLVYHVFVLTGARMVIQLLNINILQFGQLLEFNFFWQVDPTSFIIVSKDLDDTDLTSIFAPSRMNRPKKKTTKKVSPI